MHERNEKTKSKLIYPEECYSIIGCNVYKTMESVYQECLKIEYEKQGIPFKYQPIVELFYNENKLEQHYIPDFFKF